MSVTGWQGLLDTFFNKDGEIMCQLSYLFCTVIHLQCVYVASCLHDQHVFKNLSHSPAVTVLMYVAICVQLVSHDQHMFEN